MIDISQIISPSYLVGGSVRDILLGNQPKDYDYATPIMPDDVEQLVQAAGRRAFVTGKRFGTIGFKHDGEFVEVTTFRSEEYGSSRKPVVEFVPTLQSDLSRRDFTMNAIAYDGKYIDPYNGREDIKNKLIRAVGNPTIRFKEDPLRMLRAARFAAQLGFDIEEKTLASMTRNAHSILSVSKERWVQELDKLLISDNVVNGLKVLFETDLIKFVLPELRLQREYDQNSDWHELTLDEHTFGTVAKTPNTLNLRWAALLHDIAKPFVRTENRRGRSNYVFHDVVGAELIYGIGKRLKWSNERINEVSNLVRHHLEDESPLRQADNATKSKKN